MPSPSAFVAIIGHQPTSVLDLLKDGSSHGSTKEPDTDAAEVARRACFVATPPQGENDGGAKNSPNQEEEDQCQCQAWMLTHEEALRQQQEELNAQV